MIAGGDGVERGPYETDGLGRPLRDRSRRAPGESIRSAALDRTHSTQTIRYGEIWPPQYRQQPSLARRFALVLRYDLRAGPCQDFLGRPVNFEREPVVIIGAEEKIGNATPSRPWPLET